MQNATINNCDNMLLKAPLGQYEANPVFWLATQESQMGSSFSLTIAHFDPVQQKNL